MGRNTEIDPSNMSPRIKEIFIESLDYCVENNLMKITPDVMTIVLVGKPEIEKILIENGVSADKLKKNIILQVRRNAPIAGVAADYDNVSFTRDTAIIMSELILKEKFSNDEGSSVKFIDILEAINEYKGTILNEVLKQAAPEISNNVFSSKTSGGSPKTEAEVEELLKEFTVNYTELAADGHIDPVIGRDLEIQEISEVLARKKKNNVILLGDAGVGKTSVVEGLALGIVEQTAPETLLDKEVFSIDTASLLAGTKYRGEFEERARNILRALAQKGNAIVFIDEAHTVMSAGASTNGGVDLANIMKPMLARGELTCIAATTFDEYRKTIQKDSAMVRRFQNYTIKEPSDSAVKEIISKLTPVYESFHGVTYAEDIAERAVEYGRRFLQTKRNPDKSIDILDAAGAYAKVSKRDEVTLDDVMYVVSKMAGIPKSAMTEKESNIFVGLEDRIKKNLFNQNHVIDGVVDELVVAKAGMKQDNKPLGSFLLTGSSGTGKTEFCRQLAHELDIPMVKIDMSEYQEKHSVAKLIGAPPGYAGYDDNSAKLVDDIEKNPNCLLLLDEIEKAHPQVLSVLLQVMDDATITSSHGKVAKFNNVIIVMTSNLGAKHASSKTLGLIETTQGSSAVKKAIENFFAPEFINRLNATYEFNSLDHDAMVMIVRKELDDLNSKMVSKNVTITLSEEVVQYLAKEGFDPAMGARPLQRVFSDKVKRPLSRQLVMGSLIDGGHAVFEMKDGELQIDYQ